MTVILLSIHLRIHLTLSDIIIKANCYYLDYSFDVSDSKK